MYFNAFLPNGSKVFFFHRLIVAGISEPIKNGPYLNTLARLHG